MAKQRSSKASMVGVNVSTSMHELMRRSWELGVLEGKSGAHKIPRELQPVLDGLVQILAGGEVRVEVVREGEADTVKELKGLLKKAIAQTNALNKGRPHICIVP